MFVIKHQTTKEVKGVLKPIEAIIGKAENLDKAVSYGINWLKTNKFPVERYYRYWTEGNVTTVDYGSWSSFLKIYPEN